MCVAKCSKKNLVKKLLLNLEYDALPKGTIRLVSSENKKRDKKKEIHRREDKFKERKNSLRE